MALSLPDIHDFLRSESALIVHFSGAPSAGDHGIPYPTDLRDMIDGTAMQGVSSSLISPRARFTGDVRDVYGTIGVVLDLKTAESLVTVGQPTRWPDRTKPREFAPRVELHLNDLKNSLPPCESDVNEWAVCDFFVRGIFAIDPLEISDRKRGGGVPYSLARLRADFPQQRIYSYEKGQLVERHPRGNSPVVSHHEIYR